MKFLALLLICVPVQSTPVGSQFKVPLFEFGDEIEYDDDDHHIEKKSISDQCPDLLELEGNEDFEQPSRLSLPTLMTLSNEEESQDLDTDRTLSEIIYQPEDVLVPAELDGNALMLPYQPSEPRVPLSWSSWANYLKYMQDSSFRNRQELPYQLSGYGSENSLPSVRSLPPVSMQIHETLMGIEEQSEDTKIDNALYFPPIVRSERSRGEGLLELFKNDGIILPNIIPTMPVPFVRTAGASPGYPTSQDAPLVMVIFPGKVPDCAIPFLFGCSPKVGEGIFAQAPYDESPAATNSEYRKEPDPVKSHTVNQVVQV